MAISSKNRRQRLQEVKNFRKRLERNVSDAIDEFLNPIDSPDFWDDWDDDWDHLDDGLSDAYEIDDDYYDQYYDYDYGYDDYYDDPYDWDWSWNDTLTPTYPEPGKYYRDKRKPDIVLLAVQIGNQVHLVEVFSGREVDVPTESLEACYD